MPTDSNESTRNVFVATVGSRPLVLFVDGWVPGTIEDVTDNGETVSFDGEPVFTVVFNG